MKRITKGERREAENTIPPEKLVTDEGDSFRAAEAGRAACSAMVTGPRWKAMDARPRRPMTTLRKANIPESPGVYAVYRDGEHMYVGKANCLRNRVWKDHSGRGKCLTGSALRRNVAEHLDIASSAAIKARRYQLTAEEVAAVRLWLDGCDIAWIKRNTEVAAERLESDLKAEYKPPLTRQ